MALEDTDNLLVQRGTQLHKVSIEHMAKIQDDDLLLVARGSANYKINGLDLKDSVKPPAEVIKPQIIAPADGAGEAIAAESDEIISAVTPDGPVTYEGRGSNYASSTPNWNLSGPTPIPLNNTAQVSLQTWDFVAGTSYSNSVGDQPPQSGGSGTSYQIHYYKLDSPGVVSFVRYPSEVLTSMYLIFYSDDGNSWIYDETATQLSADNGIVMYPDTSVRGTEDHLYWAISRITIDDFNANSNSAACTATAAYNYGVGDPVVFTTLTLAGDKDLTVFKPLDDVQQDSGHTPQTSPIQSVGLGGEVKYYIWNTGSSATPIYPLNKADLETNGTPVTPDGNGDFPGIGTTDALAIVYDNVKGKVGQTCFKPGAGGLAFSIKQHNADGTTIGSQGGSYTGGEYTSFVWTDSGTAFYTLDINASYALVTNRSAVTGTFPGLNHSNIDLSTELTFNDNYDLENFRVGDFIQSDDGASLGFVAAIDDANNKMIVAPAGHSLTSNCRQKEKMFDGNVNNYASAGLNSKQNGGPDGDDPEGEGWQIVTRVPQIITNAASPVTYRSNNYGTEINRRQLRLTRASDGATTFLDPYPSDTAGNPWSNLVPADFMNVPISKIEWKRGASYENVSAVYVNGTMLLDSNSGGTPWSAGQRVVGPATTPATGTIGSIGPGNTMTLSVSDETSPKRWIVNQSKFVKGEEKPSQDAAPDPSGVNFIGTIFASNDGSLVAGSADWQVAAKADTNYTNPISQVTGHTEMTPSPKWTSGELAPETEYRARTKYKATTGEESAWSDDVTFKTASSLAAVRINAMKIYGWSNGSGGWIQGGSVTDLETYLVGANHYNNDVNDSTKTGNNCVYSNAADGYIELLLRGGAGAKCEVVWGNMNSSLTNAGVEISGDCQEAGNHIVVIDTDKNTFPKFSLILTATKEDAICRITTKPPTTPVAGSSVPNGADPQLAFYYISGLPGAPATVYHPNNLYSELSESPTSAEYVKLNYGINPEADSARAAAIGVYPLEGVYPGFEVDKYVKFKNKYIAIPEINDTELALILNVRDNYA